MEKTETDKSVAELNTIFIASSADGQEAPNAHQVKDSREMASAAGQIIRLLQPLLYGNGKHAKTIYYVCERSF
jgi:hypothetical protein